MGILVITWNFPPRRGGIENLMAGLCSRLRRKHPLFVITSWAPSVGNREEWLFRARWPGLPAFFLFALFRGFFLLRRNPEIRVILGGSAMVSPLVLVLARLLRRKSVVLAHGLDLIYPRFIYQSLFARWIRNCDRIVANSRYTASLAEERGAQREFVCVIPPAVDWESAHAAGDQEAKRRLGLEGKRILLFVGRLARRKGVKEFLEKCFSRIVQEVPGSRFLVVGVNPTESLAHHDDILAELGTVVRQRGWQEHVRLLGWLSDGELAKIYQASDLVVLPVLSMNDDVEGFGIVILEAAAAGKPAVATRVGGIPDAIEDGKSGVLVKAQDYEAMSKAIVGLLRDDRARQTMGDYARRRMREKFCWEEIARQYDQLFASLIRGRAM